MGRNAKLRASRHSEAKSLRRRHVDQHHAFINGVHSGSSLNVQRLVDAAGGADSLPSGEEAEAIINRLSPSEFTRLYGYNYSALLAASTEDLTLEDRKLFSDLCSISPALFQAFCEYQGFCCFRPAGRHDWARLRKHVVDLSLIPEFAAGLEAFGLGPGAQGRGLALYRLLNGSMIKAAQVLNLEMSRRTLTKADGFRILQFWLVAGDHIESAADIAAGRVLCDAGDLVLHYRRAERLKDAELCLSHRSPDGLLHFNPDPAATSISPLAVKKLRAFVRQYNGPKMAGKISDHPRAARLCKAIGLAVRNGHGFLTPANNAS